MDGAEDFVGETGFQNEMGLENGERLIMGD